MTIKKHQAGISLIELMIAMVLGLFIVSGLLYVYLGSKSSYSTQGAVARVQEALRFGFEYLAFDLRMAGYSGCANVRESQTYVIANPPVPQFGLGGTLRGYENGSGWTTPTGWPSRVAGTDVLTVSALDNSCGANITTKSPTNANLKIDPANTCGFQPNEVLMVTDCRRADVFRPTSVSSGGGVTTLAHANNFNTAPKLISEEIPTYGSYDVDAFIARVTGWTYYIGINNRGNPALYRGRYDGAAPEELVEGVYDMQIEYGLDTVDDTVFIANQYLPASSINAPSLAPHWGQVVSAKVTVRARSEADNLVPDSKTYTYNSNTANNVTDRRYRQSFTTVIGLRNLVQ
jgi:type IV pilus assembly protein PilW